MKRIDRVQKFAAGYVLGKYAATTDILTLGWLPNKEQTEFALAKLVFKALKTENWPEYLQLSLKNAQNSRSRRLVEQTGSLIEYDQVARTFQFNAGKVFNDLPLDCRLEEKFPKGGYRQEMQSVL